MPSFFSGLFKRGKKNARPEDNESFAARLHRFKLFLGAYIEAYSEMMTFEERLASVAPLGMPFLRMCITRLTIASMQCAMQLNALGEGRFSGLNTSFQRLRENVQEVLSQGATPLEGPLVIPFDEVGEHPDILAPSLVKLKAIRESHPEFMPRGFVVTGAAWWRYFNNSDMHDEIDRIMVISHEDPSSYSEASFTIRERINRSFPLPKELQNDVSAMLDANFTEMTRPGHSLLIRCMPVLPEHASLVMPEQILHTPFDAEKVLAAIRSSMAMAYRTRSLIFRLKRGIRDRAMPLCVSLTLIPEVHGRGSAHRRLEASRSDKLFLRVRSGFSVPDDWPSQASVEGASLPGNIVAGLEKNIFTALKCLADAPVPGNRHEIFWTVSEKGDFYLLGVNALPDPVHRAADLHEAASQCPTALALQGGNCTYPGLVEGRAFQVRNFVDALSFPIGNILLLQKAAPRWAFLLDFASGAVCGDGTGNGLFARTARRYGRPSVLRQPEAFERLTRGEFIRLVSSSDLPPLICRQQPEPGDAKKQTAPPAARSDNPTAHSCRPAANSSHTAATTGRSPDTNPARSAASSGRSTASPGRFSANPGRNPSTGADKVLDSTKKAGPAWPLDHHGTDAPLWLPDSDIAHMARGLAPLVASLTLPDSDDVDFRAENCNTFHDILVYSHVHAVREMFRLGTTRKSSGSPAKQLVCDVPKQFWVINLDDGFTQEVQGPVVHIDNIASLPMRYLWEGFTDKPWDGPPPINARGFLSVLFEATANPNLEPASQSRVYTEKNVFLITKRFCSMRCRFGFHFLAMDCFLSERDRERFAIFQFKGGAADLHRRIKRVHFVAELLTQFDFATEIMGDTLTARLEGGDEKSFLSALRALGYLVMHTRQLDMIMDDDQALATHRFQMLEDMLSLYSRPLEPDNPTRPT